MSPSRPMYINRPVHSNTMPHIIHVFRLLLGEIVEKYFKSCKITQMNIGNNFIFSFKQTAHSWKSNTVSLA